ncbi:MAG: hypothetical protein RR364_08995 [Lachnospiraceae bacterium]
MKHSDKKFLLVIVGIMILICGLAVIIRMKSTFHFEKSLDEVAYTVDGKKFPLKSAVYYIMLQEDRVSELAEAYDEKNPTAYWNLYIDNRFVSSVAAETAFDYCIQDYLYSREAEKKGISLNQQETEDALLKGKEIKTGLTKKQAEATQLTVKELQELAKRRKLIEKYVRTIAKEEGIPVTEEALSKEYGLGSDYFKSMKKKHHVTVDKKLLDKIPMGFITIN